MADVQLSEMLSHVVDDLTIDDLLQQTLTKVKLRKIRKLCTDRGIDFKTSADEFSAFWRFLKQVNTDVKCIDDRTMCLIHECMNRPFEIRIKNIVLHHIRTCVAFMKIQHPQRGLNMFEKVRTHCIRHSLLDVSQALRVHQFDAYAALMDEVKDSSLVPLCATAARLGLYTLVDLLGLKLVLYTTKMSPQEFTSKHSIAYQYQHSVNNHLKNIT